jgi:rhodanese-related sulfurtransferase
MMKTKFLFFFLTALIGLTIVCGGCDYITGEAIALPSTPQAPQPPPAEVKNLSPEEIYERASLSSRYPAFIYIDVRTPEEYAGGHIDDAININYNSPDFRKEVDNLDKNELYVVYCQSGARSAAASKVMLELGFRNIINMTGGYGDWVAAGLPVNK